MRALLLLLCATYTFLSIDAAAFVIKPDLAGKQVTNGQRFKRGLPPLPPRPASKARKIAGQRDVMREKRQYASAPPTTRPASDSSLKGGFGTTCTNLAVSGHYLSADCQVDGLTETLSSTLDLNQCLANSNGQLQASDNGGAFGSCSGCSLFQGTTIFCGCPSQYFSGGFSSYDLNGVVGNNDGVLVCYEHSAAVAQQPPPPGQTRPPTADITTKSGAGQTCTGFTLSGSTLSATCQEDDQTTLQVSSLDLNHCLGNSQSTLVASDNGNYASSCNGCAVDGTVLRCGQCFGQFALGGSSPSSIDLNSVVGNQDGTLLCYEHVGSASSAPASQQTAVPASDNSQKSGAASTCSNFVLSGSTVSATCQENGSSMLVVSSLDLNKCLGNNQERLVASDNGNYANSCNSCTISGTTLHCDTCFGMYNGGSSPASFSLTDVLANNNGVLQCFEHIGSAQ